MWDVGCGDVGGGHRGGDRADTAVGGTLGGYWFAGRNEEKRDERTAVREAAARRAALAERLDDQRHEIQRETLMALQTELVQLARLTAQIVMYDRDAVRKGATGVVRVPDELSTGFMEKVRETQQLESRILDDPLRGTIRGFLGVCAGITASNPKASPEQAVAESDRQLDELNTGYGALRVHSPLSGRSPTASWTRTNRRRGTDTGCVRWHEASWTGCAPSFVRGADHEDLHR
jgi:hypothetical protein